jgi:hypothetical protein
VTDDPLEAQTRPRDLAGWVGRYNEEQAALGRLAGQLPEPTSKPEPERDEHPERGQLTPEQWATDYAIRSARTDRNTTA